MPPLVYRIIEVLSVMVLDLPLGTNLGMFQVLWAVLSGRLLASRGALLPALAASGLAPAAVRRAWAGLAYGVWDIHQLLARFQALVRQEGRWHRLRVAGWCPVAVDHVGFFRPRLSDCPTTHYTSQVGRALPALPFGVLTAVGAVAAQTVPILHGVVRAAEPVSLLAATQAHLASDEFVVADRGFTVAQMQAAQVTRFVLRVAKNFSARRATLPAYAGRGRRPTRGRLVRPLARTYRAHTCPATPPDRSETWRMNGRCLQAQVWDDLVGAAAPSGGPTFCCYLISDPLYANPLLLVASIPLTAAEAYQAYRTRWPVEQVPLAAKQLLGAHRQFVFGADTRHRLPEVALLSGSLLMYLAATQPAHPTGFWDRAPKPTAGRLRRQLAAYHYSEDWPLLAHIRKKDSVTDHLPKGITAHRRTPGYLRSAAPSRLAANPPCLSGN